MNPTTPTDRQPCPCGSGKSFRKCCGKAPSPAQRALGRASATPTVIMLSDGRRLPPDLAMQEAMTLHRGGRFRRAADIYRAVLATQPKHADALHLLGVAERQLGRLDEAIALIRRAIIIKPEAALYHSNLAEAHRGQGNSREAEAAARHAVALDARLPEAWLNLGLSLHLQKRYAEAIETFQTAVQLRPDYLDAQLGIGDALMLGGQHAQSLDHYRTLLNRYPDNAAILSRVGIALRRAQRTDEAIAHYLDCIARQPHIAEHHNNLAQAYILIGHKEEAKVSLRRYLALAPGDRGAQHQLNALEGKTTERAPAEYVRDLFDNYADTFESHLVEKLDYHMPQLISDTLRHSIGDRQGLVVLDLGCGTGLMGEMMRDISGRLVGVDISPKMVAKTLEKGFYQEAHAEDLLSYMRRNPAGSYDVVVAADVFVYLGDLQTIFYESRRLLRRGGFYAFTVEATGPDDQSDFVLDSTGRYRHGARYLRHLAEETGFTEANFSPVVIRTQHEQPVHGYLCVYSLPAD